MSSPRQAFPGMAMNWRPRIENDGVILTASDRTCSPGCLPRYCGQVPSAQSGVHRTPSPRYYFRRPRRGAWRPDSGSPHWNSAATCPVSSPPSLSSCCSSQTCTVPTGPGYCGNSKIAGQWSVLPVPGRRHSRRTIASCRRANSISPATTSARSTTDSHLVALVLGADREAADDLRHQVLAPLDQLRPNTAERLAKTLRSWLLHQGQRDAVAADLFVHAQTVRYRMTQLRELYGERLNDPQTVLELIVALSIPTTVGSPAAS